MPERNSVFFERRAAEARAAADHKGGGREARVQGHLALAYAALARRKEKQEIEE